MAESFPLELLQKYRIYICVYIGEIMKAKVQKWGNSLGIRIPKAIAVQAELVEGSEVELVESDGLVTFRLAKRRLTLDSIVKSLKKSGPYTDESDLGDPIGKEVW